jgi:AcrR family transcriptional regulator
MARVVAERADVIPLVAEVFRTYGFEGASLARITEGTGLGKGSIYHFFPGGKDEMAAAVLGEIDQWFRQHIFQPLRESADAGQGIAAMFAGVEGYFQSGQRVCLVGVFALGNERDRFADAVRDYFEEWIAALAAALVRCGRPGRQATALAQEVVGAIQGALVLARACDRPALFKAAMKRLKGRLQE